MNTTCQLGGLVSLGLICFGCTQDAGECRPLGQEGDTGQGQGGSIIVGPGQGGFGDDTVAPQAADPTGDNGCDLTTARDVVCLVSFAAGPACPTATQACIQSVQMLSEEGHEQKDCMGITMAGQSPLACIGCTEYGVSVRAQWKCKGTVEPCLHAQSDDEQSCYYNETYDYPGDPTNLLVIACEQELAETFGGSWVCATGSLTCKNASANSP